MYQKPKWASFTLPNREGVHIYRDPPKSVHTRKYEPVSEADILYNIRADQVGADRLSENILWIARATNPAVDVDYGTSAGNGARTLHLPTYQGRNPYPAFRDGAFRPPLYPLDALQPLSRARYLNPAVSTNPDLGVASINPTLSTNIDRRAVLNAVNAQTNTNPINTQPTLTYKIALPLDIMTDGMTPIINNGLRAETKVLDGTWVLSKSAPTFNDAHVTNLHRQVLPTGAIVLTPITASAQTTPTLSTASNRTVGLDNSFDVSNSPTKGTLKSSNKELILQAVKPNYTLVVHDSVTNRSITVPGGSIQDKNNIAVQTALGQPLQFTDRTTGQQVKLKDYRWKIIQSTPGGSDALIVTVTPNNDITQQTLMDLSLEKKVSMGAVNSAVHNMNSGAGLDYSEGIRSLQSRSTNADIIHIPATSMFQSSASENTRYEGGTSINDRQSATQINHSKRQSLKARASDVRESFGSSVNVPMDTERVLRLRTSKESIRV
jgi:hypothetical protein